MVLDSNRLNSLLEVWLKVSEDAWIIWITPRTFFILGPINAQIFDETPGLGLELANLSIWNKIGWAVGEVNNFKLLIKYLPV